MKKNKFLTTTALVAPAMFMLTAAVINPAYAACNSTDGPASSPDDGATVTCSGDTSITITGNVDANVTLQASATLSNAGNVIALEQSTINMGDNSRITSTAGTGIQIYNSNTGSIVFGDNITIQSANSALISSTGNFSFSGTANNVLITSTNQDAMNAEVITGTLGDNVRFIGSASNDGIEYGDRINLQAGDDFQARGIIGIAGINDQSGSVITLGNRAQIVGTQFGVVAIEDLTLTLGDNAYLNASYGAVYAQNELYLTVGDDAQLLSDRANRSAVTAKYLDFEAGDDLVIESGGDGIEIYSGGTTAIVTIGQNGRITANSGRGIDATEGSATVSLGTGTQIQSRDEGIISVSSLTMSSGSSVTSSSSTAVIGTNGGDTLDISGTISGSTAAIDLGANDDGLTLRSGANIVGNVDGGTGLDTLTLAASGSEEANFLNFEVANVNGTSWTLSGTSTLGTVNVNNGTFINNGSITGSVGVASGTRFGGTGTTIGTVTNTGTVAPGNSIGTQIITGNFVQNAGGTLEMEVDVASADQLDISGTAALDGTLNLLELNSTISAASTFTIIDADGGVSGTFANITDDFTFLNPNLTYNANTVVLGFTASQLDTEVNTSNGSESKTAAALDRLFAGSPGALADVQNALNSQNPQQKSNTLSSQSNTIKMASVSAGTQAVGQNTQAAMSRVQSSGGQKFAGLQAEMSGISAGSGYNAKPAVLWLQATGGTGQVNADSNARGTEYTSWGSAFGAEWEHDKNFIWGLFGGYSQSSSEYQDSSVRDKGYTDVYQLGAYGGYENGLWDYSGSVSAAYMDFETKRPTALGTAHADFDGYGLFADLKAAYDYTQIEGWNLSPYGGLELGFIHHESYDENGAAGFNLAVDSDETINARGLIGLEVDKNFTYSELNLTPKFGLGWSHEFGDQNSDASLSYTNAPTVKFDSEGPKRDRDSLRLNATLTIDDAAPNNQNNVSGFIGYSGDYTSGAQDHAATLGVRWRW